MGPLPLAILRLVGPLHEDPYCCPRRPAMLGAPPELSRLDTAPGAADLVPAISAGRGPLSTVQRASSGHPGCIFVEAVDGFEIAVVGSGHVSARVVSARFSVTPVAINWGVKCLGSREVHTRK